MKIEACLTDDIARTLLIPLWCCATPCRANPQAAYDPVYGARPLRRSLQHTVETLISRKIIAGEVEQGDTLAVDCRDGALTVSAVRVE